MSYEYHRRQYDPRQATRQLHPYQPVRPRHATCWDPLGSRDPPGIPPYDQPPPKYRHEPYGPPHPHQMGSIQTRRPTCWDPPGTRPLPSFQPYDLPQSRKPSCWEPPPHRAFQGYSDYDLLARCPPSCWDPLRQQTDNCYPPSSLPDSYIELRNSYARYRPWQPKYHPRPATKAEGPINTKLDRLLEAFDRMETWVGATNRRVSKFRSSPQPEPDLDQPNISAPIRKMAYPPSRNTMVSFVPLGLPLNVSSVPLRQRTIEYTNRKSDFQSPQRSSMPSHCHSVAPPPAAAAVLSSNLPQPAPPCNPDDDGGKEGGLLNEPPPPIVISSPCSPYIMGEDESLLDDK
ncbi:leucine-rich repeat extensin-like protein 3 [Salvia splendens]|uniref:leucine-rich repeat extensin-like protein 3 n=1 Tax=Salvia splendens TaxID=180675 RepID=UPI001C26D178|nr:leucine-rich repeat extensin-like protein 3 [Salvia splendens]